MRRIGAPGPRLDVRDLQVVLALASEGTTAAAAKVMHLTQSATSRALLLAEEKLGVRLFERSARGLVPTGEGDRLIQRAGPLLASLVDIEEAVRAPAPAPTRVRLVCECYTAYRWLPSALAAIREGLPQLEVTLAIEHTYDPAAALASGEIDVALLTTSPARGGAQERPLFADEIVFVMAASHALASRPFVTARDLRATTVITSQHTPPAEVDWFMRSVFGRARPKLRSLRFPLTEALIDAARAGMGVAVLSEWIASGYLADGGVVTRRFGLEPLRRPWRIAYQPASAGPAIRLASALEGLAPRIYPNEHRRGSRRSASLTPMRP